MRTKNKTGAMRCASPKNLARIAILAALGFLIMHIIHIPLPFAPGFMDLDFGDVPALIGGFVMGPLAGVLVQLLKNLLKLLTTSTLGIGEISNFIVGASFVFAAAWMYRTKKTKKRAICAMLVGTLCMAIIATLSNAFFIFPAYAKAAGLDLNALVDQLHVANGLVKDYPTLMLFSIFPFNLVKGGLQSLATFFLYKHISPILHGDQL